MLVYKGKSSVWNCQFEGTGIFCQSSLPKSILKKSLGTNSSFLNNLKFQVPFKYFVIESPLMSFGIKNECGSSVLILKVDKSSHSLYWALENKTEKIKKILKIASFMLVVFLNLK